MKKTNVIRDLCASVALLMAAATAWAASPQEALNAALLQWVAAKNEVPSEQVTITPPDSRVSVQPCAGGFSFDYPFVSRDTVRARCLKPNWQLFVKVGFSTAQSDQPLPARDVTKKAMTTAPAGVLPPVASQATTGTAPDHRVVVAGSNLLPGQLLLPDALKLEPMDAEKISRAYLLDVKGLEGHELVRAVRAGEPIRTTDIRPAIMIRKGEQVQLVVGKPETFRVMVTLEAMQDGKLGDQIKLRNGESGRTLSGIVTGKGSVRGV